MQHFRRFAVDIEQFPIVCRRDVNRHGRIIQKRRHLLRREIFFLLHAPFTPFRFVRSLSTRQKPVPTLSAK